MAIGVRGWNSESSAVKTYQSGNREIKRITCYDAEGNATGTISISRSKKPDKTKTKKLNYNFKEVSAFLMKAKTSGSARRAVAMAQRKVIQLRKKLKKGEYNDQELESALAHAEAIERAAKKHLKNLQKEERTKRRMQSEAFEDDVFEEEQDRSYGDIVQEAMRESGNGAGADTSLADGMQNMVQDAVEHGMPDSFEEQIAYGQAQLERLTELVQQGVQETMEELLSDTVEEVLASAKGTFEMVEESLEVIPIKPEPEEFAAKKKKHRSDVMRDIVEADMKYLKAFFDRLQKEKQSAAGGFGNSGSSSGIGYSNVSAGVSLELNGASVPVKTQVPAPPEGGSVDVAI
ncbi:MAG: hypothetical protein NC254_01205 [bacterium]|nr:hypothetical protein [bacterium]